MLSIAYEAFYEVASHQSFSKAAEALYISQPAVSKQVKKLEGELGVPLFERKGSSILLTISGEKLLMYLKQAKQIQKQIDSDLDIIKTELRGKGELRIGASTTLSLYVLPRALSNFQKKWPQVKITLINRNTENILNALVQGDLDLAVVEDRQDGSGIRYDFFMKDKIIPVCSSHSPYAGKSVSLNEFVNVPLVMRELGSGTLSAWSRKLDELKIRAGDLNIKARLGGTEALKNFLIEDTAVGFLSPLAIKREMELGLLSEVDMPELIAERDLSFVTRTGETLSGVAHDFIKEVKQCYNQ
ncbi:MAG: LysR family transcriptional regulator [Roseivirga sp.]|nr:LysR family transcriptional regulator [Roseivirga sp.]